MDKRPWKQRKHGMEESEGSLQIISNQAFMLERAVILEQVWSNETAGSEQDSSTENRVRTPLYGTVSYPCSKSSRAVGASGNRLGNVHRKTKTD
jgi:hypothetical protein